MYRAIHTTLISFLSASLACLIMLNSCTSTYEFPISLTWQGILIPPATENIPQNKEGLTEISSIDPSIIIDLKYKTSDNFTGKAIYPKSFKAVLRPKTAVRLAYANQLLKEKGFRIKVWDAYRPQYAQIALWEASGRNPTYVADPHTKPSLHTYGAAVDLTLVDLDGNPVKMPTKFDDFSKNAATDVYHTDPVIRENLATLKLAMRKAGFQYIFAEWWHFLDHQYEEYEPIPDTF